MKYLVDFDRTLFDFEALKAQVTSDEKHDLVGMVEFWEHYTATDFLFPDVLSWLEDKGKDAVHVLTAFSPYLGAEAEAYQREKIHSGGFNELVGAITVMEGEKGLAAAKIAERFLPHEPIVFIDDWDEQCASVKKYLPQAHCFLISRYGVVPEVVPAGVTVVSSLREVDGIMSERL
jgi:hypothetical protein